MLIFYCLRYETPQPGGPGPRIHIPQEQVSAVGLPGTGFPLRRLLRLAGIRWRYSNPPLHGCSRSIPYVASARTAYKTPLLTVPSLLRATFLSDGSDNITILLQSNGGLLLILFLGLFRKVPIDLFTHVCK
jgi:hypothetical protein